MSGKYFIDSGLGPCKSRKQVLIFSPGLIVHSGEIGKQTHGQILISVPEMYLDNSSGSDKLWLRWGINTDLHNSPPQWLELKSLPYLSKYRSSEQPKATWHWKIKIRKYAIFLISWMKVHSYSLLCWNIYFPPFFIASNSKIIVHKINQKE